MGKKVSEVTLTDFRAFKGENVFSFKNRDRLSQLVVLYAPNGWGKTSFFDGIEWALNGEIKRISRNLIVRETARREKGIILKNKDTINETGKVKIDFSNGKEFTVETKKIDRRRKTDYIEGDIIKNTVNIDKKKLSSFVNEQILTHDAIDAILTSESPVNRYESLADLWDDIGISHDYKKLHESSRIIKEEKKNIQKEIGNKEQQISKVTEKIDKIVKNDLNTVIKEINEKLKIDLDFTLGNIEQFSADITLKLTDCKSELDKIDKKILLIKQIPDYLADSKKIAIVKKELEISNKILDNFSKLEKLEEQKGKLEKKLLKLSVEREKVEFLKENKDTYLKYSEKLKNLIEDISKQQENISKYEWQIDNNEKSIIEVTERIKYIKNQQLDIRNKQIELEDLTKQIGKMPNMMLEMEELRKKIEIEKEKLEKTLLNKSELISSVQDIGKFFGIDIEAIDGNIAENFGFISKYFNNGIEMLEDISEQTTIVNNLDGAINSWRENENLFNKVKSMGLELIRLQKLSDCPLCNTGYSDYIELENRINKNYIPKDEIKELELSKKNAEKIRNDKYNKFIMELKGLRERLQVSIKQIDKEIDESRKVLVIYSEKKSTIENEYMTIEKNKVDMLGEEDIDVIEGELKNRGSVLENEKINFDRKLSELLEKKSELAIKKANTSSNIKQFEIEVANVEAGRIYQKYKNDVKNYDINKIATVFSEITLNINRIKSILDRNNNNIFLVKNELLEKNEVLERERKEKLEEDIDIFCSKKERIENLCIGAFSDNIDNIENYNLDIEFYISEKKNIEEKVRLLNQGDGILKNLKKEYALDELKVELKKLEQRNNTIEKVSKLVSSEKEKTLEYIREHVDKRLDLEIINKVFTVLEPHVEWNKLGFKINAEEKAGLGLGLDFVCQKGEQNDGKNQGESPILYLSSAQVNILSLSIFLAKIISMENKEINTIFMDDPIEYLDSLNELSFIDLLRVICFDLGIQVIISTHDSHFFKLCKNKLSPDYYSVKYIDLLKDVKQL